MRPKHLTIASMAFLIIAIAAYFGASIHNSKTNSLIDHLNQMDHINHYSVKLIPTLNFNAALFTLPLLLVIVIIEVLVIKKSGIRTVKNIAIGSLIAALIIITVGILTMGDPEAYDFSRWGYIWITLSLIILAGNLLSIFIKPSPQKV